MIRVRHKSGLIVDYPDADPNETVFTNSGEITFYNKKVGQRGRRLVATIIREGGMALEQVREEERSPVAMTYEFMTRIREAPPLLLGDLKRVLEDFDLRSCSWKSQPTPTKE